MNKKCLACNKNFKEHKQYKNRRFCSNKCSLAYKRLYKNMNMLDKETLKKCIYKNDNKCLLFEQNEKVNCYYNDLDICKIKE